MSPISSTIGMNSAGDTRAEQGAAPARQRLEADDPPGRDGDDRLEVDLDPVGGDRRAQFELDQPANLDFGVHLRLERPPHPPPVGFRRIKRDIRFREQRVGTEPVVGRRGAADACADDHLAAVDDHGAVDFVDDALGEVGGRRLAGRMMVKDDEFVAAPARDEIARADDRAEPACDLDQELVAGAVAEAVVDLLEVVEVEKHHGEAVARGAVAMKGESELSSKQRRLGSSVTGVEARHAVDFRWALRRSVTSWMTRTVPSFFIGGW